jgi:hypothetical protein
VLAIKNKTTTEEATLTYCLKDVAEPCNVSVEIELRMLALMRLCVIDAV